MPFVQRVVKPEFVSRSSYRKKAGLASISDDNNSNTIINGKEFDSFTNITLSNALRQMASVVIIANDIFLDLNLELQKIGNRTKTIKERIYILEENVSKYNPKEVEVPESDFETFLQIKDHFKTKQIIDKELFVKNTRPINVQNLYEAAGKSPAYDIVDSTRGGGDREEENATTRCFNGDGTTSFFSNFDSFEQKKLKIDSEIEIRLPASIGNLRKWTSAECVGEVTVTPDCINKVSSLLDNEQSEIPSAYPSTYTKFTDIQGLGDNNDAPIDHRLPSPEEQCQMIAIKYPAEIISVDVTGRRFERMCLARKSMCKVENSHTDNNNPKDDNERKTRSKKSRSKRRNTIIGIDPKEISEAVEGEILPCKSSNDLSTIESISEKSKSSDLLRKEPSTNNESGKSTLSRLNSLKNWGRNRLKLYDRSSDDNKKKQHYNFQEADSEIDEYRITSIITNKNKKKFFDKGKSYFSTNHESPKNSDKNLTQLNYFKSDSASNSPESINNNNNNHQQYNPSASSPSSVKLRESSSLRRQRRNDSNHKDDPPHSSSGNWSASSESGRASIGSEITILPKSSASSISLNHNTNNSNLSFGTGPPSSIISRRRFLNTSASSSITSEGPSTPDPQIMNDISFIDDETSSSYSCDTEGYYTSFHIDSGLKTLREEEPVTPLHSTSALSSNNSIGTLLNHTGENDYELFGRGSTSTTASSAGTVCTTLILPNENDINSLQFPEIINGGENKLSYSSSNCSSSTAVSTLERCATIKRNNKISQQQQHQKELIEVTIHLEKSDLNEFNDEYKNSNDNNLKSENQQVQQQQEQTDAAKKYELDCAEYSDVESVDRSERIRQKTAISSSRIPSMCIITPTTSDDENSKTGAITSTATKINRDVQYPVPINSEKIAQNSDDIKNTHKINMNLQEQQIESDFESDSILECDSITESLYDDPLNELYDKQDNSTDDTNIETGCEKNIYHTIGEYVTLSDICSNNKNIKINSNNENTNNNSKALYGNIIQNKTTEYVSLKELPLNLTRNNHKIFPFGAATVTADDECQQNIVKINKKSKMPATSIATTASLPGASTTFSIIDNNNSSSNLSPIVERNSNDMRVTFNAQGNIIYNSDSLKRQKKRGHSTFLPGPHVKDADSALSSSSSSTPSIVVGVIKKNNKFNNDDAEEDCYVKLINKKPVVLAAEGRKTNKLLMSGGCANRAIQKIRPVNCEKDKMQNNNYVKQNIICENIDNSAIKQHQEEINDVTDSANEEMQQHRDFQNLLHQTHEPFNRNAQIYGTLPRKDIAVRNQKMMSQKPSISLKPSSNIYKSSNILPSGSSTTMSPIVPCNKGSFRTSTPSKLGEKSCSSNEIILPMKNNTTELKNIKAKNNIATNFEEIPKVCSDRMGTAKTSLMDFKKLLLAKSTKHVTSSHKLSAVEMLKVAKENAAKTKMISGNNPTHTNQNRPQTASASALNSSMLLLDLSRSPRSFANRRMIRQGQFGSPLKYNMTSGSKKQRNYGLGNTIGTDVMSTTIPEANREDDSTSSSGSIGSQKSIDRNRIREKSVSDEHIDLKNNFFLQAEENNFMKSEIDASKYRSHLVQYRQELAKTMMNEVNIKNDCIKKSPKPTHGKQNISVATNAETKTMTNKPPSFETSL